MATEELLKLMDKWFFAQTNEEVYHNTKKPSIINMGKSGSSHFRDPPLISEESPLKSEAVLI